MATFMSGFGVIVEFQALKSYGQIEQALDRAALPEAASFDIDRQVIDGVTRVQVSVHVDTAAITGAGVPKLDAAAVLHTVGNALTELGE